MKDKYKSRDQLLNELSELHREVVEKDRILNFSNDLICIIGIDGYFKYLNLAWERACGYSRKELLSRSVFDFVHHDDRHKNHDDFLALVDSGKQNIDYENHIINKDGSIRSVSWTATPLPEEGLIYCIGHDITECKRATEAFYESEGRFRAIFDNASDGILVADPETKRFYMGNKTICQKLGYGEEEIKNLDIQDIHPEKDFPYVLEQFEKIIRKEIKLAIDIPIQRKDRSVFYTDVNSFPLIINGKPYIIGIFRDITERKKAEKILQEKERELEIKAKNLEEANIALKVLLRRTDEDRAELEEKVLLNVRDLVVPYLEKLKSSSMDETQRTFVNILEANLIQIISPFSHNMTSKFLNFTPTEIQVADLLRKGKTSKEIGELLNTSPRAITFHRGNIRKKLGLKNKKANLKSYLLSLN